MPNPNRYLYLSDFSLQDIAVQVNQNGSFQHTLRDSVTLLGVTDAHVTIEQCSSGLTARIEIGESVNTITLGKYFDSGHRLGLHIEALANDHDVSAWVNVPGESELVSELEKVLRKAVADKRGTHYLPVQGIESLALLLRQSSSDPRRTAFLFELDGVNLTIPMLLPGDRELAYSLLKDSVDELVANYSAVA